MKNLLAWLDVHFEDALCGVLLVGIMIMLMAQVVVRFAFGHGLTFSEELCRFSFLYLVYFAASLVACKGALLIDSMSTRPMVSGSMLLDLRYVYFAVPAAFTLQSFRILQRWYRHFRGGVSILGQQQEEV